MNSDHRIELREGMKSLIGKGITEWEAYSDCRTSWTGTNLVLIFQDLPGKLFDTYVRQNCTVTLFSRIDAVADQFGDVYLSVLRHRKPVFFKDRSSDFLLLKEKEIKGNIKKYLTAFKQ